MPETKPMTESKKILGSILARAFEVQQDHTFDDLMEMLNKVKPCRELVLEEAEQRVTRLLNNTANTQLL